MDKQEKEAIIPKSAIPVDPDHWYEQFEQLPEEQQYDWIMRTLDRPLTREFLDKLAFIEYIFELPERKDPEKYATLIRKLRAHPEFYEEEFGYLEHSVADYLLFADQQDDDAALKESLNYYVKDPVKGVDQFIPLVSRLVYYRKTALALDCAIQTYHTIDASPEVMGGAAGGLGNLLLMVRLQQAFLAVRAGGDAGWSAIREELAQYGYQMYDEKAQKLEERIEAAAVSPDFSIALPPACLAETRNWFVMEGIWKFSGWMLEHKQLDFAISEAVWVELMHFLHQRKALKQSEVSWDSFFRFSGKELEKYLSGIAIHFLSNRQSDAFAMLWGTQYVYDFLLEQGIVEPSLHAQITGIIDRLKIKMLHAFGNRGELWKYAFVERWPASDYAGKGLYPAATLDDLEQLEDLEDDDLFDDDDDDDDDSELDWFLRGPSHAPAGMPSSSGRAQISAKQKQAKKKANKQAKQQRKKNRKR